MIPDGWKAGKIKDLIKSLDAGVSVNSEDRSIKENEFGILKTSSVTYGIFAPDEHKVILSKEMGRAAINPKKDRIIISRMNTPNLAGASVYISQDYPKLFLPDRLWQAEPRSNNFSMRWFSYLIASDTYREIISGLATGTSNSMKNISKPDFLNIEILIPPLLEQCRIAEVLGVWDESIDLLERLIGRVRSRKQGLMQQLLTGKKRFKEFDTKSSFSIRSSYFESKLGELPDDWSIVNLPDVLYFQEGPGVQNHQFTQFGVKLLNGSNIQKAELTLDNTSRYIDEDEAYGKYKHFLVDAGDLVIASSGISVDKFEDKIAFVAEKDLPLCMNTSTIRFKVKDKMQVNLAYFKYFMMTALFKDQIRRQITGSAQLNFGPTHLNLTLLVLPSLPEQEKIAAILSAADEEISTLEKQLAAYKQQKLGLMQQLLTGKIRVG
jgi:type I restriction enzyme, S subunit